MIRMKMVWVDILAFPPVNWIRRNGIITLSIEIVPEFSQDMVTTLSNCLRKKELIRFFSVPLIYMKQDMEHQVGKLIKITIEGRWIVQRIGKRCNIYQH